MSDAQIYNDSELSHDEALRSEIPFKGTEDLQIPDIEGQEGRRECLWHSCPALAGPVGNDAT